MTDNKTLQFIKEHADADIRELALKSARFPEIDMSYVIRQIAGRQIMKTKVPAWYRNEQIIYPSQHISLEQSSSEKTALYKASLCKGGSLIDLTGGLGIDFSFMSKNFSQAVYVDKQEELANIAEENFRVLGLKNCKVVKQDATIFLGALDCADTIYIDPSRRDKSGKKTFYIEDCTPNLIDIFPELDKKAGQFIIKLSPMLDIARALKILTSVTDIHIISVGNECKELLFVKNGTSDVITYHCVNIFDNRTDKYVFTKQVDMPDFSPVYTDGIKKYLYEPNTSILKSGAYNIIAVNYKIEKLHPNSHLYTSDEMIMDFPGRIFKVKDVVFFNRNSMKNTLSNIKNANITTRNFPLSVQEIRDKTKIKEGGSVYIFATTFANDKKVMIICEKYNNYVSHNESFS